MARKETLCGCGHVMPTDHSNHKGTGCTLCECRLNRAGQAPMDRVMVAVSDRKIIFGQPSLDCMKCGMSLRQGCEHSP